MKEIKVKDIIKVTNGKLILGDENEVLENFKKDTREINIGDTYVGIKGEKIDGSTIFEKAFENGAKACLIEKIEINEETLKKYQNKVIIEVKDSIDSIQKIAKYKRKMYDIPVVRNNRKCRKNKHKRLSCKCNGTKI